MLQCTRIAFMTASLSLLAACAPGPESAAGFRLPDGDPVAGEQAFLKFQCHACHRLPDVTLPELNIEAPVSVMLGGPVSQVKTYGQLVTAIINPSHRLMPSFTGEDYSVDGESFMPTLNQFMTVSELIDIVAFLQDRYDVMLPMPYPYAIYRYDGENAQGS